MRLLAALCLFLLGFTCSSLADTGQPAALVSDTKELQQQIEQLRKEYSEKIAELERKIDEMSSQRESEAEAEIRQSAEQEAQTSGEEEAPETPESATFASGALGLQALNPEISAVADAVSWFGKPEGDQRRTDFDLRVLDVHFESYLDPYSKLKAAVGLTEHGAELGEAYLTRYDVGKGLNLTLGKFHQQFGVVNRWHAHGLDQVNFPLAIRQLFGGPLESTGVSLDWLGSGRASVTHGLTVQITNGANERLFAENSTNFPSLLVHYKNYRDLSKDTYFEAGFTGLLGRNDEWRVGAGTVSRRLWTRAFGVDLTLLWEPTEAMRYRNWVWRTEGYFVKKRLLAPDGSGTDSIKAWGAYSYFQRKISRTTEIGTRLDYFRPDRKSYAQDYGDLLGPVAVAASGAHQWQLSPYVTWWQSEWVKWRFEYNRLWGDGLPDDNRFFVQCTFAAGPHKHERY